MVNGVVMDTEEGTPQGGPLSPLLANIMLDDLDKELEQRGLRFVRYADDCNIYVASERAAERVMASVKRFLAEKLSLKVNERKSTVDRPWRLKFLGFSFYKRKGAEVRVATRRSTAFGPSPATDETHPAGQAGASDPGSQSVHDGLDRLLPVVRCQERVRGAGRVAEAAAAATGLETLEARQNPLARTGQAGRTGRMAGLGAVQDGPWRMAASPVVTRA